MLSHDILIPLFSAAVGGAGVYAAIRADLAELKARIIRMESSSDGAHRRIDDLLQVMRK